MKKPTLIPYIPTSIHPLGVTTILIVCLAVLGVSCSETGLRSDEADTGDVNLKLSSQYAPSALLNGKLSQSNKGQADNLNSLETDGFTSPLFGLATAPNGNILVADAGAGIATLEGATEIALPGVTDMSPIGRGAMWALEGLTGSPGDDTGQALYRVSMGKTDLVADLFDFELLNNPAGGTVDSNPFDVQSLGGNGALVADAGANSLLHVDNQGAVTVVAVLPNELVSTSDIKSYVGCPDSGADLCGLPDMIPAQPVATSVAIGPDGYYYVGELKGFPAPLGESNIWRISPDASGAMCGSSPDCVKVFDGGFTSIIDLAFDEEGNLYVVELDEQSWFAVEFPGPSGLVGGTINTCDMDALTCSEVASGIPILTAITFGKDGSLWATKNALIPGLAEVIKVQ